MHDNWAAYFGNRRRRVQAWQVRSHTATQPHCHVPVLHFHPPLQSLHFQLHLQPHLHPQSPRPRSHATTTSISTEVCTCSVAGFGDGTEIGQVTSILTRRATAATHIHQLMAGNRPLQDINRALRVSCLARHKRPFTAQQNKSQKMSDVAERRTRDLCAMWLKAPTHKRKSLIVSLPCLFRNPPWQCVAGRGSDRRETMSDLESVLCVLPARSNNGRRPRWTTYACMGVPCHACLMDTRQGVSSILGLRCAYLVVAPI